jgi:hypothetical protein
MDNNENREKTMKKNGHFKRRFAVTVLILCGVCLTGLSMFMSIGSDRL